MPAARLDRMARGDVARLQRPVPTRGPLWSPYKSLIQRPIARSIISGYHSAYHVRDVASQRELSGYKV